jgi:tetratricopeptide (TPR) repeat protein
MDTYFIRVSMQHAPDVWRVIEIRANQKLRDLHAAIAESFGLDPSKSWRFFLSNRAWDRASQHTSDATGRQPALSALGLTVGSRFLHVAVDGQEEWYRCEVTATGAADPAATYPRVVESQGEPPSPLAELDFLFGGAEEEDEEGEAVLAAEALDDAARALGEEAAAAAREHDAHFEREDAVDAPRPREVVERDLALAKRLVARFADHPEQFDALVAELDAPVLDWLELLPFDLEDHGMLDEAIALAEGLAPLVAPAELATTRATLLQEAGRDAEAVEQAERVVDRFPDDPNVRARAARVLHKAGEQARAEDLCRSVLDADLEGPDAENYGEAIEVLGEILRASGRAAEAEALEQSEQAERAREAATMRDEGAVFDALASLGLGLSDEDEVEAVRRKPPKQRG